MLVMLFAGVVVSAVSSTGLCCLGYFDAAWYAVLLCILQAGLLINELGQTGQEAVL